jgi:hypothetical protein
MRKGETFLAKWLFQVMKNLRVKNAPSGGKSGRIGSFSRDPKAIQVKRVGYQLTNASGGGGRDNFEGPEADFNIIDQAIKRDSYLMQSVMKYEELIFKSGWSLQSKNDQALQYVKLRLEMMAIATGIPTEELFQGIARDIVRYSNCFIAKARAKNGQGLPPGISVMAVPPAKDPVVGYFRLPPQTIQIARDKNGNVVKYKQEVQGAEKPIEFRPEDIIHIKVNVPPGKAFGDPWLAPILEDVRLLRKVEENAALLLYRHIFPLLKYKVGLAEPGWEATDEELEELRAIIEDMPTDGAIVLPERHDVEAVEIKPIDGKPYLEYFENRVFSGLGLSQVDFGRGDTANRSTADAMTGIKADRVKGFQQAIMMQIDKYIIDELLVEGGFDPIVNPEFDVNFVFNEIELERKIAKETHEVFKFNNNIQTWEETRINMGMDPVADESRLHFNMIGAATSKEADNKNQPENQNGKRTGPKRATERVQEIHQKYFYDKVTPTQVIKENKSTDDKKVQENVMDHVSDEEYQHLIQKLEEMYLDIEQDTIDYFKQQQSKMTYPLKDTKGLFGSLHFGTKQMENAIRKYAEVVFKQGVANAKDDLDRKNEPSFNHSLALQTIHMYTQESLSNLKKQIISLLEERLEGAENLSEATLIIKGVFESMRFKVRMIAKVLVARSYNYGYALSIMNYGVNKAKVIYTGEECSSCKEKAKGMMELKQLSDLDEVSVFYKIPPWHPNCECELKAALEGGEM